MPKRTSASRRLQREDLDTAALDAAAVAAAGRAAGAAPGACAATERPEAVPTAAAAAATEAAAEEALTSADAIKQALVGIVDRPSLYLVRAAQATRCSVQGLERQICLQRHMGGAVVGWSRSRDWSQPHTT
jgi:hypothetical protein